jgi:hypothetical protein
MGGMVIEKNGFMIKCFGRKKRGFSLVFSPKPESAIGAFLKGHPHFDFFLFLDICVLCSISFNGEDLT